MTKEKEKIELPTEREQDNFWFGKMTKQPTDTKPCEVLHKEKEIEEVKKDKKIMELLKCGNNRQAVNLAIDLSFIAGQNSQKEKDLEMIEELKKQLISRMCFPNKPINTFENAREQEEVIKEEFEELTQKIKGDKK